LGNLASAIGIRGEETSVVAELKAGSEEAFSWLIAHYHQPVYSLVYRMVNDPADAADTVQRRIHQSLPRHQALQRRIQSETWIYRIAVTKLQTVAAGGRGTRAKKSPSRRRSAGDARRFPARVQGHARRSLESPFECAMHEEVRAKVEVELAAGERALPYHVILRDIEDLSYEEIAEITGRLAGTVSRALMRGRQALKKRLEQVRETTWGRTGISPGAEKKQAAPERARGAHAVEVLR